MTSQEAASILAVFHGAYPNIKLDDAVAITWANALDTDEYHLARQAVHEWVSLQQWWPSIAEFRAAMRRIKELNSPKPLPQRSSVATMEEAKEAFSQGYRRSRMRLGDDDEQIEEKLGGLLRKWPDAIEGVRA